MKIQVPFDISDFDPLRNLGVFDRLPWLKVEVLGNNLYSYGSALVTFCVLWMTFRGMRFLLLRRLSRAISGGSDIALSREAISLGQDMGKSIWSFIFPVVAFALATQRLELAPSLSKWVNAVAVTLVTAQVVTLLNKAVGRYFWTQRLEGREVSQALRASTQNIVTLIKFGIWIAGVLFILDNLGVNISTFVAGLGIGGVALALAAQALLGDTFSSFAIAMDKPFEVGDFIAIENFNGTVENIGFKTTRVRALSGELLVFSNSDMTKSRIRNYRKMQERRIHFRIGVVCETSVGQLAEIPTIIKNAVESQDVCRFDRANFLEFSESAFTFDIVFWVKDSDYLIYANAHQAINLRILESFRERDIQLAYATRTLYVVNRSEF